MPESLYFLDVYMPNDGEPDTTLAVAVLRLDKTAGRPSVYLHTLIKPEPKIQSRVRWSKAFFYFDQRVTKDTFLQRRDLPTLNELLQHNYLQGKTVICFNPNQQPYKDLTQNASKVWSILEKWQEVFADDEKASGLTSLKQILEYLNLTASDDQADTCYTALLYRLHSEVAVWRVLQKIKNSGRLQQELSSPAALAAEVGWPLPAVSGDIFREASGVRSFAEIRPEVLCAIFSDAMPDYLDWHELSVYSHDWKFSRRYMPDSNQFNSSISSSINTMAEFLFNQVLSMQMRFWVLIYYSIYDKKTNYAREIALKNGQYRELTNAVRDDFSIFLISHLDDFLDQQQRQQLLRSIINQVLSDQGNSSFEHFNFESLQKKEDQEEGLQRHRFIRRHPEGCSVYCFKEIIDRRSGRQVYRRYEISGRGHDRDACIDFINKLFADFLREASNPFSRIWCPEELTKWVQYITGFTWQALTLTPADSNADPDLDAACRLLRTLMQQAIQPWMEQLQQTIAGIVEAINQDIDGACLHQFVFQGISVEVEVKKPHHSFFGRLLNF